MRHFQTVLVPWFVAFLLLALAHQLAEKAFSTRIPVLDNYLDPLLFMPILLHLILWERRILFKQGYNYVLPSMHIVFCFLLVSWISEVLFPMWNSNFTGDWRDVLLYGIGTLMFIILYNKPYKQKTGNSKPI